MLSAAAAALLSTPAMALDEIKTVINTPVKTSTATNGGPDDITIDSGGGISLKTDSATPAPLITIDSSNNVNNGGALSAINVGNATAVEVNTGTTPVNLTGSFTNNGTIDLTGTGSTKKVFWLTGAGSFTGNVIFDTGSSVTVKGDNSTGITMDAGTVLNGDLSLAGAFAVNATAVNGLGASTSSGVVIANLQGTINGNVTLSGAVSSVGGTYTAVGQGATGFVIGGPINGCTTGACAGQIGTFANSGSIGVVGVQTRSTTASNAESGSALIINNSIAGGILNNGPSVPNDTTTTPTANIVGNGLVPVVLIQAGTIAPLLIGQDTADGPNPGYNFINRGTISASPLDSNVSATTIRIAGTSTALNVQFTPGGTTSGFFNSGLIIAQTTSSTNIVGSSTAPGTAVSATALEIDRFVTMNAIVVSSQAVAAGTVGSVGAISAAINGPFGGIATAIYIAGAPVVDTNNVSTTVTTVPEIDIQAGARVTASASVTATEAASADVASLAAVAIRDLSNSLTTLNNAGAISATATTLTNGKTSVANAVDASFNTVGLTFTNTGSVTGDVLFGSGNDTYTIQGSSALTPATHTGLISFNGTTPAVAATSTTPAVAGGVDNLHVGQFANVAGTILSGGTLDVHVDQNGILSVQNIVTTTTNNLQAHDFITAGGTLTNAATINITVSQNSTNAAIIATSEKVTFGLGTKLGIQYGGFISNPTTINLISAPTGNLGIQASDVATYNAQVGGADSSTRPFLFQTASIQTANDGAGHDVLQLTIVPKTAAQLGLTGYAKALFSVANVAIVQDTQLGAAMIAGINASGNDPTQGTRQAQAAYDAFAPDVSGGARDIAISITDQATGVVAARQRALRLFGKQPGDLTLWGNEFGEYISTKGGNVGSADPLVLNSGAAPGFKDHGFGFSLGLDEGSANSGWYGAAFTFYSGDIAEGGDRTSKANSLWYLLTGYTDWRGKGLFLDTQLSVGYGNIKGKRFLDLTIPSATVGGANSIFTREADSKRAGLLASLGGTLGAIMHFGATTVIPQLSLDGMSMREEGYTETGGGGGFDLAVKPYYANSLRLFVGSEFREDINLGDFYLQPSARIGYRYDFLNDPVKLRAAFADINANQAGDQNGQSFTLQGPDPAQGNYVAGFNIAATTENWTIGLNYDFVRGSNNATEQVGTLSLLGRI